MSSRLGLPSSTSTALLARAALLAVLTLVAPTLVAPGLLGSAAHAAPTLTVSPTVVRPGQTVTVSGSGFAANERVDVYFDDANLVYLASSATGVVNGTITVPSTATSTTHYVSAEGRRSLLFVQATLTVDVSWPQQGYGPSNRSENPYETALDPSTVGDLSVAWTRRINGYGNHIPLIAFDRKLFTTDILGNVTALSTTGGVLWRATTSGALPAIAPAGYGKDVFVGDDDGLVRAYRTTCATGGATCTARWTVSVGSQVTGDLVIRQGRLYVPSDDGTIHVLNPTTGAEIGTPLGTAAAGTAPSRITYLGSDAWAYARGNQIIFDFNGFTSFSTQAGTLSPLVAVGTHFVFAISTGVLSTFGSPSGSATMSGAACGPREPAAAGGRVFAGCTSLTSYRASTLSAYWSNSLGGGSFGYSPVVAGDVVYACSSGDGSLLAYDRSYGGELWSGGSCNDAPVVANGTLYSSANGRIFAYTPDGTDAAAAQITPPTPARLSPSASARHG